MVADVIRIRARETVFEIVGDAAPRGITWAWARQDLDTVTAKAARAELNGLFAGPDDPDHLLVHLGAECFVDLRGLRVLVDVAARIRRSGGVVVVVAPPHCVRAMVGLFHLDRELPLAATAQDAVRWVRTRTPVRRAGWFADEPA